MKYRIRKEVGHSWWYVEKFQDGDWHFVQGTMTGRGEGDAMNRLKNPPTKEPEVTRESETVNEFEL